MTYILAFDAADAPIGAVGGKGANLVALTRAGFPVPPGFLVTTAAYQAFVAANGINDRLLALACAVAPDDPAALECTAAAIRALFAGGQMPPDIASALDAAYQALPGTDSATPPVAVRSSATAEDLPGLSFAGQQETYLNIIGAEAVRQAVQQCWASLWTERALAYRARNGIAPDEVALAVVVQQMIPADVSGVLFTANPLTGRRDEMVIDASFGLGEAVVSGQVEPDRYRVDPRAGRITERKLGAKAVTIVSQPGGGTTTLTHGDAPSRQQALPDAEILALARLAGRVAAHYGAPQDIEWAWTDGQLTLLQARPITTLYPLPARPDKPAGLRIYLSVNSLQGVMDPLTPVGRNVFSLVARALPFQHPETILLEAGGRLFIDTTEPVRDPHLRNLVLAVLERGDPGARAALLDLLAAGRIPSRRLLTPRVAVHMLVGLRSILGRAMRALRQPEAAIAHAQRAADRYLARVRRDVTAAPDLAALLAVMVADNARLVPDLFAHMMPFIFPGVVLIAVVDRMLGRWLGLPPGTALQLLRGLPGNVTTAMDLKLWAAAQAIRADAQARTHLLDTPVADLVAAYRQGSLPPVAQQALAGFLAEYGMRAVAEIDLGRPRWREDPASILQSVQSYLQMDDPALAPDQVFRRARAEAERLGADYVARVRRTRFGPLRARLLAGAIHRMRVLNGIRETPKLYAIKVFDLYRTALLGQGRALVERGLLDQAEDIFFVPFPTLQRFAGGAAADLRATVASNRAAYDQERTRRQLPRLLLSTGEVFYAGVGGTAGSNDLVGDPVSPGTVEGTVRVVLDPRGVRLEPGEILVCPATDPGWTPLFLSAGGLVMEIGGMVTHGSVVAREYGIPAVVGVHEVTTRLHTGQRVRVDGSAGRVTILE